MSRLRAYSTAACCVLCAVILAGCVTTPKQINSFDLQSHKFANRTYGPFKYADGTEVVIGKSTFTMVINAELAGMRSFRLKSRKFPDNAPYGPFKCKAGQEIMIGKSKFTISAVY